MAFSRLQYWSGLPFPSPRDLPSPGIEPTSLMSPALPGRFFTTELSGITYMRYSGCSMISGPSGVQLFCDPMDCSPPGSPVPGISQAKYWSGLSFCLPGDLPDPGRECMSPAIQADSLLLSHLEGPLFAPYRMILFFLLESITASGKRRAFQGWYSSTEK